MGSLISFEKVSFSYEQGSKRRKVIQDLSFEIQKGEFLAITGPSGSGKSTILSLLAGLKRPQSGKVVYEGKSVGDFSENELAHYLNCEVGMIYQFFNLIPHLSVLENVMLPALIGGVSKEDARRKALDLLADVKLLEKTKSKIAKLSGGQQQRVAIARVFINNPKLILADEPTGNLDKTSTDRVMEMLCRMRENNGTALVVVTHDKDISSRADSLLSL